MSNKDSGMVINNFLGKLAVFLIIGLLWLCFFNLEIANANNEKIKELYSTGLSYQQNGQYKKALKSFQEALEIGRKLGNDAVIALLLKNIGNTHHKMRQYEKAINSHKESLALNKKIGLQEPMAWNQFNIGTSYSGWEKYEKAIQYYLLAFELFKGLGNDKPAFAILNSIGTNYMSLGKYDMAFHYTKKALTYSNKNNEKDLALNHFLMGEIYRFKGQFETGINFFSKIHRYF